MRGPLLALALTCCAHSSTPTASQSSSADLWLDAASIGADVAWRVIDKATAEPVTRVVLMVMLPDGGVVPMPLVAPAAVPLAAAADPAHPYSWSDGGACPQDDQGCLACDKPPFIDHTFPCVMFERLADGGVP